MDECSVAATAAAVNLFCNKTGSVVVNYRCYYCYRQPPRIRHQSSSNTTILSQPMPLSQTLNVLEYLFAAAMVLATFCVATVLDCGENTLNFYLYVLAALNLIYIMARFLLHSDPRAPRLELKWLLFTSAVFFCLFAWDLYGASLYLTSGNECRGTALGYTVVCCICVDFIGLSLLVAKMSRVWWSEAFSSFRWQLAQVVCRYCCCCCCSCLVSSDFQYSGIATPQHSDEAVAI
jgi:hypothetical protein